MKKLERRSFYYKILIPILKYFFEVSNVLPNITHLRFNKVMAACARQGKRAKVILSNVTNVYSNLALEHWILNNWKFSKFDCLLVYRNEPCVVVGRFQNTWREVNVSKAKRQGLNLRSVPSTDHSCCNKLFYSDLFSLHGWSKFLFKFY